MSESSSQICGLCRVWLCAHVKESGSLLPQEGDCPQSCAGARGESQAPRLWATLSQGRRSGACSCVDYAGLSQARRHPQNLRENEAPSRVRTQGLEKTLRGMPAFPPRQAEEGGADPLPPGSSLRRRCPVMVTQLPPQAQGSNKTQLGVNPPCEGCGDPEATLKTAPTSLRSGWAARVAGS